MPAGTDSGTLDRFHRYFILLVEGGIYSDSDTAVSHTRLKESMVVSRFRHLTFFRMPCHSPSSTRISGDTLIPTRLTPYSPIFRVYYLSRIRLYILPQDRRMRARYREKKCRMKKSTAT